MLAIAPMPVDSLRDRDALERINSRRIKVPAIPAVREMEFQEALDEMIEIDEPDVRSRPLISSRATEDAGFIVTGYESSGSVVLPAKRGMNKRQIGTKSSKLGRPAVHDKSLYRPAAPVSEVVPQVEQDYRHKVIFRTYLLAALVVLVFLFLAAVIYIVKVCAPAEQTAPVSMRPIVAIEKPDFSHLKDQYGKQAKLATEAEKKDPKNLKTTVIQEREEE